MSKLIRSGATSTTTASVAKAGILVSVLCGAGVLPTAASAQGTFGSLRVQGIELVRDGAGSGVVRIAGNDRFLSEASICGMWRQNLGRLNELAKSAARDGANPRMPRGFSVHSNARSELTSRCSARAEVLTAGGGDIRVRVTMPGNRFFAQITQPTVLGGWADPKFTITYDLQADITIRVPRTTDQPLGIGRSVVTVSNIGWDGRNWSGDLAKAVNTLVGAVRGQDLVSRWTQDRSFVTAGLKTNLDGLNRQLQRGFRLEHRYISGRELLQLHATMRPPATAQLPVVR